MNRIFLFATLLLCALSCGRKPASDDGAQAESFQAVRSFTGSYSVDRIWEKRYSAFPSIVRFRDAYYVSFREAESHIFDRNGIAAGQTRILRSEDGQRWESVALLSKEGYDLRDPKLSVTADGRLMVIQGGSVYVDRKLTDRIPQVSFSADGRHFSDPEPVVVKDDPAPGMHWFWRMTWVGDTGYTVSYGEVGGEDLVLYKTTDGLQFEAVTEIGLGGFPNESTLRLLPDGRLGMLIRREREDKMAWWGVSQPPFTEWDLKPLNFQIGGPDFIVLEDGTLVAGGRAYVFGEHKTYLWKGNADGRFSAAMILPSGGDNSYPGFLQVGDELWVVYYSSHELENEVELSSFEKKARAGIYLARVPLSFFQSKP